MPAKRRRRRQKGGLIPLPILIPRLVKSFDNRIKKKLLPAIERRVMKKKKKRAAGIQRLKRGLLRANPGSILGRRL